MEDLFEVGDKVKVINNDNGSCKLPLGAICLVVGVEHGIRTYLNVKVLTPYSGKTILGVDSWLPERFILVEKVEQEGRRIKIRSKGKEYDRTDK
jgi:hypothetical protein